LAFCWGFAKGQNTFGLPPAQSLILGKGQKAIKNERKESLAFVGEEEGGPSFCRWEGAAPSKIRFRGTFSWAPP